jgi:DNA processing protein
MTPPDGPPAGTVRHIPRGERGYPHALAVLPAAPVAIQLAGCPTRLTELLARPVVALLGSRRSTHYGREVAGTLARELALGGVTVIAGLSEGIEAAAHHGALGAGGRTIAVLPTPPHTPYPAWQRHLHTRVLLDGCALAATTTVSAPRQAGPHLAGTRTPIPARLLARNRLLAALADLTILVEATRGAGAMLTAEAALELGRTVAAVPGRTSDPCATAPNLLIRDGAHVVLEASDALALVGASAQRPAHMPAPTGHATAPRSPNPPGYAGSTATSRRP